MSSTKYLRQAVEEEQHEPSYSTHSVYVEVTDPTYTVRFTNHAAERWDERTPAWSTSPEQALRDSISCEWLHKEAFAPQSANKVPDVVRYYAERDDSEDETKEYDVLFMEVDRRITTVYVIEFIEHKPVLGYLNVLRNELVD